MKSIVATMALVLLTVCAAEAKTIKHDTGNGIITFETETRPQFLTLFATSKKPFKCEILIKFNYEDKQGKRQNGERACFFHDYPAGDRVNICEAHHELLEKAEVDDIQILRCDK